MSIKRCCSLCCSNSSEYKFLQNDMGESNKIYEITVKYFDPMLFTDEESMDQQHNQVLCVECWFHINDFHKFQQTVLKSRLVWEDQKQSFPTEVKQEDNLTYAASDMTRNESIDRNEEVFLEDYLENQHFKTESITSLEDNLEEATNNISEGNIVQPQIKKDVKRCLRVKTRRGRKSKLVNIKLHESDVEENEGNKQGGNKLSDVKKEKGSSSFNLKKARESDAFIAEWKPELICDLCSDTANNFDKLRSHFKEKHKTRFYIKCCERKFFRRCVLVNHIRLHLNPETHKCDICGKSSSTKHNLKLHKKVMHEDTKQLKCDICEKLFKQKVTLERHLLTHATGSKDFICPDCGKGYVAEQLLKLHIKHVHNVDRVCDQCGKTLHGFQALKKHLMEHAGIERPKYPCDVCGLELKSPNGLKRHKAAYHNDGSTIYICGVCGKVAASKNALWNHKKLVHIEERKHKCTYCEKAFKRPKSLREHIATHTGQDLYQCPNCPQTFKVSANMHHHRKKIHPVEWEEGRKNRLQQPKININQVKKQVVI